MTVMVKKTEEAFEMRVGTIKDDTKDESGASSLSESGGPGGRRGGGGTRSCAGVGLPICGNMPV